MVEQQADVPYSLPWKCGSGMAGSRPANRKYELGL
jgi:hypothetical protein